MKLLFAVAAAALAFPVFAQKSDDAQIKRGRYLVQIGGCNDCHTAGYAPSGGKVPEAQWLLGDALGWHGPWGTTYATNLRLYMQDLTEEQWVKKAKTLNARPPMPWFNVRAMTTATCARCTATSAASARPASRRRRTCRRTRRRRSRTSAFPK